MELYRSSIIPGLAPGRRDICRLLYSINYTAIGRIARFYSINGNILSGLIGCGIYRCFRGRICHVPCGGVSRDKGTGPVILSGRRRTTFSICDGVLGNNNKAKLLFNMANDKGARICLDLVSRTITQSGSIVILIPRVSLAPRVLSVFRRECNEQITILRDNLSVNRHDSRCGHTTENRTGVIINAQDTIFTPLRGLNLVVVSRRRRRACGDRHAPHCRTQRITGFEYGCGGTLFLVASTAPDIRACSTTINNGCILYRLTRHCNRTGLPGIVAISVGTRVGDNDESPVSRQLGRLVHRGLRTRGRAVLLVGHQNCGAFVTYGDYNRILAYPGYDVDLACRDCGGHLVYRCYKCAGPLSGVYPRYKRGSVECDNFNARHVRSRVSHLFPSTHILHVSTSAASNGFDRRHLFSTFSTNRCSVLINARVITGKLSFPGMALINIIGTSGSLCSRGCATRRESFSLVARIINEDNEQDRSNGTIVRAVGPCGRIVGCTTRRSCGSFCGGRVSLEQLLACPPCYSVCSISFIDRSRGTTTLYSGTFLRGLTRLGGARCRGRGLVILNPKPTGVYGVGGGFECELSVGYGGSGSIHGLLGRVLGALSGVGRCGSITMAVSLGPCRLG